MFINKPVWLLIGIAFMLCSCNRLMLKTNITPGFQGTWSYSRGRTSFNIQLYQEGSSLKGTHCSVMQSGNKIDCEDDDKFSITGSLTAPNIASVTYHSYSSLSTGKAAITKLTDSTIEWKVIEAAPGENYIPGSVILKKE